MRFLVTRPQPDCRRTAEKLRALGHVADEAPVLKTVEVRSAKIGLEGVSALAFSSRRSVAVLSAQGRIDALRSLPVFTVGDVTALACREAGFSNILSASGDIAALAQLILDNRSGLSSGAVLYPAAEDRAGDLEGLLAAGAFPVAPSCFTAWNRRKGCLLPWLTAFARMPLMVSSFIPNARPKLFWRWFAGTVSTIFFPGCLSMPFRGSRPSPYLR